MEMVNGEPIAGFSNTNFCCPIAWLISTKPMTKMNAEIFFIEAIIPFDIGETLK
jgi:hypothetical protein